MNISYGKLNRRHQTIIFALAVLTFIWLCVWLIFLPQHARLAELTQQYNKQKQAVAVVEQFALAHADADKYLLELDNKVNWVNTMLPDSPEIGAFMIAIENISKASGLQLVQVQPGAAVNKNGYREIPVEILVKGNYFQTLQFLSKLESLPRFNSINNVVIQARSGLLENKLSIVIYCFGIDPTVNQAGAGVKAPSNAK